MRVGFLGLGFMGTPMALNLCRKFPLTVWNRTASKYPPLQQAGAKVGNSPSQVFEQSDVVFTMLFDGAAIQSILTDDVRKALQGKTWVNTSSVSVDFSNQLAKYVKDAGGHFVEMPVSGSKVPAEQGKLVGMMAGDLEVVERIRPYVAPLTSAAVYCGPVGSGLKMKYAINLYLIAITTGLAESMNLARAQGLDLEAFGQVLNSGPLASPYSKLKVEKALKQDWSPQAAIRDCYNSTELIQEAIKTAQVQSSPILQVCNLLYKEANGMGLGDEDMGAIAKLYTEDKVPKYDI